LGYNTTIFNKKQTCIKKNIFELQKKKEEEENAAFL